MKKTIAVLASVATMSFAFAVEPVQPPAKEAQAGNTACAPAKEQSVSTTSPMRISVWPGVWTWPAGKTYGVSWGFPASYTDTKAEYTAGLDMSILLSQTKTYGAQISLMNMGEGSVGAQMSVANIQVSKLNGAQIGVYNEYKDSEGFQMGVINKAEKSRGVQFGLVNFMEGGFFPVFPLFNFNTKPTVDASVK